MDKEDKSKWLLDFAVQTLNNTILNFWRNKAVDNISGGFFGEISNSGEVVDNADKGLVLNARILWTFSSAYQYTNNALDKDLAERAFTYLTTHFYDSTYDGYYWTVTNDGNPLDTRKQIYALAFVMYGMSEFFKISKNEEAKNRAIELFKLIEKHSFDKEQNGYFEAYNQDWGEIDDMRLSSKDMNEKKTMNTHLHVLEAYANLYTIWPDALLGKQLRNLIHIFLDKIISPDDNHLNLFFDEKWHLKSSAISYGHDIEAGWLVHESALILQDKELITKVEERVPPITDAALKGLHPTGGLLHEGDREGKHLDHEFEWWPQAEALVALVNNYEITKNERYLDIAVKISEFISKYFFDVDNGEWFYRVDLEGKPILSYPKAGMWKCPYHNGRACLELISRLKN
jgi:mannobiose 2-epimerase